MKDSKQVKLAFVIPYFVRGDVMPPYFPCFLHTVKYNPDFTWILFTDSEQNYKYPENVVVNRCSFEQIRRLIQSKFDFPISLSTPKKLCDYKPAYGYIFSDELEGYDYWGYCDIDEFYGDLSKWLSMKSLSKYDRMFQLGHMSVYRNNSIMSTLFMHELKKTDGKSITSFKQIFMSDRHFVFDEWHPDYVTINNLCEESDVSVCWDQPMADIDPFCSSFKESFFSQKEHSWIENKNSPSCIIVFNRGKLFTYWEQEGNILSKEILYAHIQKRKLDISRFDNTLECFAIVPNRIISSVSMFTNEEIKGMLKQIEMRSRFRIDETRHGITQLAKWIGYQIQKRIRQ